MNTSYNKMFSSNMTEPRREPIKRTVTPEEEVKPPKEPTMAKVMAAKLNVRDCPSKTGSVLCVVSIGSELLVEDCNDGWAHIYTETGMEGYVMSDFIKGD